MLLKQDSFASGRKNDQKKLLACVLSFQQVQQNKVFPFLIFPEKSQDWILLKLH